MFLLDSDLMLKEEKELRKLLPISAFLHNCLVLALNKDGVDRDFWKFGGGLLVCHDKSEPNFDKLVIFTHYSPSKEEGERDALKKEVRSWLRERIHKERILLAASSSMKSLFQELLLEEGKVVEWEAPCHQYALFMPEDGSGSDTNSCQFGTDQTERDGKNNWMVAELEKDQLEFVMSFWKYAEKAGRGMLENLVAKQRMWGIFASSSSSSSSNSSPAAWVALYTYGSLGMLHTREDFRRQGLASQLVKMTCKRVQEKWAITPVVHIEHDNRASEDLFLRLGFSPREEPVIWMGYK